jgi:hypothetical protein
MGSIYKKITRVITDVEREKNMSKRLLSKENI